MPFHRPLVHTRDLMYADDTALVAHSASSLQQILDRFVAASSAFGLRINIFKTEVMYQTPPGVTYTAPSITIDGMPLKAVDHFKYLGSTLSRDLTLDAELTARTQSSWAAFGRLQKCLWGRRSIRLLTKLKIYQAVVLPCLLYSAEAYTLYRRHIKRLSSVHLKQLRTLLGIRYTNHITNNEVLSRANSLNP